MTSLLPILPTNSAEEPKIVEEFIFKTEKEWNKVEEKIFSTLSNESGLKWKEEKISCYIIKRSSFFPISDPITIPIELEGKKIHKLSLKRFIDMLVHELIHNLFIQNYKETDKYFKEIFNIYSDEDFVTTMHILVHSLHEKVMKIVFDEKRLKLEIKSNQYYPA